MEHSGIPCVLFNIVIIAIFVTIILLRQPQIKVLRREKILEKKDFELIINNENKYAYRKNNNEITYEKVKNVSDKEFKEFINNSKGDVES